MPFHQDATYWNLHHTDEIAVASKLPHTVVVWLAFTDVDEHNAALQVIPGSHMHTLPHVAVNHEGYVLNQAIDEDVLGSWLTPKELQQNCGARKEGSETLRLRTGEISIHDCRKQAKRFTSKVNENAMCTLTETAPLRFATIRHLHVLIH